MDRRTRILNCWCLGGQREEDRHVYEVFPPRQGRYVGLVTRTGEGEGYVRFVNQPEGR
ncbi:hypothetical protein ACTMTJ_43660 [Phytohabitans sp. LJ34]|uniref:hypothetical protein n=1 Tax=Phytohabitans sp. LJ34 TaxID=3452217 RepID=UPI003F8A0160